MGWEWIFVLAVLAIFVATMAYVKVFKVKPIIDKVKHCCRVFKRRINEEIEKETSSSESEEVMQKPAPKIVVKKDLKSFVNVKGLENKSMVGNLLIVTGPEPVDPEK